MNIEQISYYGGIAALAAVFGLWFVFTGMFFVRKKPATSPDAIRAPKSWIAFGLQGLGFAVAWAVRRRPFFSPIVENQFALNIALEILAVLLAAVSVWLAVAGIKELGRQWSLQARLIEGHKLITSGIYSVVRHPIYTAMLGMLLATSLVVSHWIGLIAAVIVFYIGTKIRTNIEEGLLRDAFGEEFATWKAKVPGLIPFLKI